MRCFAVDIFIIGVLHMLITNKCSEPSVLIWNNIKLYISKLYLQYKVNIYKIFAYTYNKVYMQGLCTLYN